MTQTAEQIYEISDIDGSNKRTVTLAQYRAELDAAKRKAMAKFDADCKASGLRNFLAA